jgi:hypothetical protein
MKMQDKEFDDVFRSKLEDIEVEPSAQVWQNIDAELVSKKRRMFPFLSIAASIILLLAAGILFIPKKEVTKPGKPGKNTLAHQVVKPTSVKAEQKKPESTSVVKEEQVAVTQIAAKSRTIQHLAKKTGTPTVEREEVKPSIAKTEPVKIEEQPVLAAAPQKVEENKTMAPNAEISAPTKQEVTIDAVDLHTKPVLASAPIPDIKRDKPSTKKKGIHNFGDLVNLVVARVDKRKDKVIEFTDTDDDQTTITGVHIGAINIKRDNSAGN